MHIHHIFAVAIKTKEFKNMLHNSRNMHAYNIYGSTYWYNIEKRIGSNCIKCIGYVWLKRIGSVLVKVYW